jgi:hypothetical protein
MDMLEALDEYNIRNAGANLRLRVGLNVGEVVAGVVGTKRFLYDLWGDAVNVASRMESSGIPGRIHVTGDVVNLLEAAFIFEERGTVTVKGKGEMKTYFLNGRRQLPKKQARRRKHDSGSDVVLLNDSAKSLLFESIRNLEEVLQTAASYGTSSNVVLSPLAEDRQDVRKHT